MSKRFMKVWAPVLSAALLLTVSACGTDTGGKTDSDGAELEKFTALVSAADSFQFVAAEIGLELGAWEERGLDVENIYVSGGQFPTTMASGTGDIGLAGGQVAAIVKGMPAKAVGAIGWDFSTYVLVAGSGSDINRAEDLKGKILGITSPGSVTDSLARGLISSHNWEPNDLRIAAVGGFAEQLAALESGATDAFIWTTEAGFQLEESGQGRVVMNFGDEVPNSVVAALWASDAAIADRPEAVQAYLDGWYEVIAHMRENKAEVVAFVAEKFKVSEAVAEVTYEAGMENLAEDSHIPAERAVGLAQYDVDNEKIDELPAPEVYYDSQFDSRR